MEWSDILSISSSFIVALGGGGLIVISISSWLAKIWADKLMSKEIAHHNNELEKLKSSLQKSIHESNHNYVEKIHLYKDAIKPLIKLITKVSNQNKILDEDLKNFDEERLVISALLAMFAPAIVFDQYNKIIDYLYDSLEEKAAWSFSEFRLEAVELLNLIRKDIGIFSDEVSYSGNR